MSERDLEGLPSDVQALLEKVSEPEPPPHAAEALFARMSQTLGWLPPTGGGGTGGDGTASGGGGTGDGGGWVESGGLSGAETSAVGGLGATAAAKGASLVGATGAASATVATGAAVKGAAIVGASVAGTKLAGGASILGTLGIPALVTALGLGAAGGVALQARYELVPPVAPRSAPGPLTPPQIPERVEAPLPEVDDVPPRPLSPPSRAATRPVRSTPAPSAETSPQPAEQGDAPPSSDPSLTAERALLEVGRTALLRGDAKTALAQAEAHALQFPRGRLAEERDALRIRALVQNGRGDEARKRGQEFRSNYPESILRPGVEAALSKLP